MVLDPLNDSVFYTLEKYNREFYIHFSVYILYLNYDIYFIILLLYIHVFNVVVFNNMYPLKHILELALHYLI